MFKIFNLVVSETFKLVGHEKKSDMQFYHLPTFPDITEFCDLCMKSSCVQKLHIGR
jgi:hypothetical protein